MSEQPLQPEAPNETETEEHTEEYDEETNALLEEWAQEGGNNTRKRRSRQHIFEQRRPYPGFQFTESIRYQHIHNLVACVRHYEAIRDDASLAAVLATLLQSEHPENLKVKWQFRNQQAHARLCEVLMCAYHLFRRHSSSSSTSITTTTTSTISIEQLKRLLRRAVPFQLSHHGKADIGLALAQLMMDQGDSADAVDYLMALYAPPASQQAVDVALMMASIRFDQWQAVMHGAVKPPVTWNPFCHAVDVWARAGRAGRDLCREAEKHFMTALRVQPERTDAALALIEVHTAQGKREVALKVATDQCFRNTVNDSDAHAIQLALLLCCSITSSSSSGGGGGSGTELSQKKRRKRSKKSSSGSGSEGETPAAVVIVERCCGLLSKCGVDEQLNCAAAEVLISVGRRLLASQQQPSNDDVVALPKVVRALCLHLDSTPPVLALPPGATRDAWMVLAQCITSINRSTVAAYRKLDECRQSLRRAKSNQDADDEEAVDVVAAQVQGAQLNFQIALNGYYAVKLSLREREWWLDCHLMVPSTEKKVLDELENDHEGSGGVCETLVARACVSTALGVAVEVQQARQQSVFGGGGGNNTNCAIISRKCNQVAVLMKALMKRGGGADSAVHTLRESVDMAETAAAVVASAEERVAFDGACLLAVSMPLLGSVSAPLGAAHPELGMISEMPVQWWTVFPQMRRRRKHSPQLMIDDDDDAFATQHQEEDIDMLIARAAPPPPPPSTQQRRVRFLMPSEICNTSSQVDSALQIS